MSSLEIAVEGLQGVAEGALVKLSGQLDQPTLDKFLSELSRVKEQGTKRLVLDMQGVSYANSTALGALVTQADTFREAGGAFALLAPQPKVNLIIEMLGLNAVFPIFNTLEEAVVHLSSSAARPVGAPRAGQFPIRSGCSGCGLVLEFARPGRYRCPHCGFLYRVDESGQLAGARARGGRPIEITVPCEPRVLAAFAEFVAALPAWEGFEADERARLREAIEEVAHVIHQQAYGGNERAAFHALVVCRDEELALRFADYGKPLSADAFPMAASVMRDFEHRPHPARGNYLKMALGRG